MHFSGEEVSGSLQHWRLFSLQLSCSAAKAVGAVELHGVWSSARGQTVQRHRSSRSSASPPTPSSSGNWLQLKSEGCRQTHPTPTALRALMALPVCSTELRDRGVRGCGCGCRRAAWLKVNVGTKAGWDGCETANSRGR